MTLYKIFTFCIYYIALPFVYLLYRLGSRKWGDRLGFLKNNDGHQGNGRDIWLHASSMGEVKVLAILVRELQKLDKTLSLHVSVMTTSGFDRACNILGDDASISYLPLDYSSPIRRFLKTVKPKSTVFIETEIWPNIIHELGQRKTPLFLANGRLSERACRRYIWFKSGLRKTLAVYKWIMVQTESDKERYIEIGANKDIIKVLGSLKFDAPLNLHSREKNDFLRKSLPFEQESKLFIAGSIRNGESELILDIFKRLLIDFSDLRLILVPRHLDRLDDIYGMIEKLNMQYCRYSRIDNHPGRTQVMVVDRLGVLNDLYSLSDIAFVGGTMVDIGGQNILEPVWAGIPVLYGPSIYNVKDSSEYIIKGGYGEMVQDDNELYHKLKSFLSGEFKYRRKNPDANEPSRARQTAQIILESIQSDAKNLVKDNNT